MKFSLFGKKKPAATEKVAPSAPIPAPYRQGPFIIVDNRLSDDALQVFVERMRIEEKRGRESAKVNALKSAVGKHVLWSRISPMSGYGRGNYGDNPDINESIIHRVAGDRFVKVSDGRMLTVTQENTFWLRIEEFDLLDVVD